MTAVEFNYQLANLESNLARYAYNLTMNKEEAEDLVQETFLKAIRYREKFDDSNLKGWTFTIMKNTFINNYRKIANQKRKVTDPMYPFADQNSEAPDSVYSAKEINKIIDKLEEGHRIPFKMHADGFKYKEIAERLNLNIGTVKSRIYFARQILMSALKDR